LGRRGPGKTSRGSVLNKKNASPWELTPLLKKEKAKVRGEITSLIGRKTI